MLDPQNHSSSLSNTFRKSSVTQKLITLGLLAFIFILPVSVIFLDKNTENRPDASEELHPIDVGTPYVYLKADDFYLEYEGTTYFFDEATKKVNSNPERNNDGYTTLELEWESNNKPLRMYLYFNETDNTWTVSELRITVDEDIFITSDTQLGAGADSALSRGEYHELVTNTTNSSEILVHFTNLILDPFIYQLEIPETSTGYFIENPPEGTVDGYMNVSLGNSLSEHIVYLRDAEGQLVTDLTGVEMQWIEDDVAGVQEGSPVCDHFGLSQPCSIFSFIFTGKKIGTTEIRLAAFKDGQKIADTYVPINVITPFVSTERYPLNISTPYLQLTADDFFVQYQDTRYSFNSEDIESLYTYPGYDGEGHQTLSLGIRWKNETVNLRLGMYFKKIDNDWVLAVTQFGGPTIDSDTTYELRDTYITAPIGTAFTTTALNQDLSSMLDPYSTLSLDYTNLSIQPFVYQVEIPDTDTGYFIENPPEDNVTGIAVTPLGTLGAEKAILRDSEGNVVTDQSSFTYVWTTDSENISLSDNTQQFCFEEYGIQEPCPQMVIRYNTLALGEASMHLSVMQGDVEVAQADFPVIVGPTLSPIPTSSIPVSVTEIIPNCPASNRVSNRKADFNNDNKVDLTDYALLARDFLRPNKPNTDANCDGKVDLNDYQILARDFLK